MPIMTSDGWKTVGYRVQRLGRYNKWVDAGLYCSQEAAEFFIQKCTDGKGTFRIVVEAV